MDVYKGPPDYDTIMSESSDQQSPGPDNKTIDSTDSDKTITPSKFQDISDPGNVSTRTDNESGLQSPFTESLCIKMLNEESFASTTTNVTAMDNESILDEVFVPSGSDVDTVKQKDNFEKQNKNLNTEKVDINTKKDSEEDDEKVILCITEKSEIEDFLNKDKTKRKKFSVTSIESMTDEKPKISNDVDNYSLKNNNNVVVIMDQKPIQSKVKSGEISTCPKYRDNILDPSKLKWPNKGVYPLTTGQQCLDLEQRPKDYVLLSCLVLVCCCSPVGLISFLLSLSVNSSYEEGQYSRSRKYSRAAFWTSMLGIFLTVSLTVILLAIFWPDQNHDNVQILDNQ